MTGPHPKGYVTDGYTTWAPCPICGGTMEVVRPGKAQCPHEPHDLRTTVVQLEEAWARVERLEAALTIALWGMEDPKYWGSDTVETTFTVEQLRSMHDALYGNEGVLVNNDD